MDIMELGAIGELVGGVAVIGSLIYVGLQVRQSAAAAHVASATAVMEGFNRAMDSIFDKESSALMREAVIAGMGSLSPEERFRLSSQVYIVYSHFETVYFQIQRGVTDPYVLHRLRSLVAWMQNTPGIREWWYGNTYDDRPGEIREMFSGEFRAFVGGLEVAMPTLAPPEA